MNKLPYNYKNVKLLTNAPTTIITLDVRACEQEIIQKHMKTYCYFDTSNQRAAERSCPAVITNHLYKHEFITCIYRCDAVLVYSFAFEKRLADGRMAFLNGHLAIEKSHAPIRPVARREGSSPLPFQPGPGGLRVGRGGSATTPENCGSGAPSLGGSRWREPPSLRSHE